MPIKHIVRENTLPIWHDWSLRSSEDESAVPRMVHRTKEVCVASNRDWQNHLDITLHYQSRALAMFWSMVLETRRLSHEAHHWYQTLVPQGLVVTQDWLIGCKATWKEEWGLASSVLQLYILPSIDIDSYYEQTSTLCFFLTLCKLQRNCVASNKKG